MNITRLVYIVVYNRFVSHMDGKSILKNLTLSVLIEYLFE